MAQRSGMKLFEADAHLEQAWLHLAQAQKMEARKHLKQAKTLIEQIGYHRRDAVLVELEVAAKKGEGPK